MDNHLRPDCLDADTLALWAERALPAARAAAVEAHIADCERCQELVATFALTDIDVATPAQPAALPFWRQWWLPLTGVAAAASITTILFIRYSPMTSGTTTTPVATSTAQAPATAPLMAPTPTPLPTMQPEAEPPTPLEPATPPVRAAKPAVTGAARAPAPEPKRILAEPAPTPTKTAAEAAPPPPPPPPPPPQAVAAAPPPAPAPRATPPPGVVGGVTGSVTSGLLSMPRPTAGVTIGAATSTETQLRADTSATARDAWSIVPMQQFSSQLNFGAGRGGAANLAASATAPRVVTYWRILSPTRVSRSADTKTWTPIDLTTLGEIALTAGAAPTADVCWLVGKNGLVLRTTDATTFVRITFPETVDLTAINSVLALDATVTTSNGHRYRTQDGGATWTRVSELSDFGTNRR